MSFSVVTNLPSIDAQARLIQTSNGLHKTLARLSSGLRINSSADDAAGLAVANRHRLDNTGLTVGIRSANDAISKLQIEDGAMNNISSLLDRALTLASQAASDTFTSSRSSLDSEFSSVLAEITRNAKAAGLARISHEWCPKLHFGDGKDVGGWVARAKMPAEGSDWAWTSGGEGNDDVKSDYRDSYPDQRSERWYV